MPSRASLLLRAAAVNVDVTQAKYNNDSVLEQAIIRAEKNLTVSTSATTYAPSAASIAAESGGANV